MTTTDPVAGAWSPRGGASGPRFWSSAYCLCVFHSWLLPRAVGTGVTAGCYWCCRLLLAQISGWTTELNSGYRISGLDIYVQIDMHLPDVHGCGDGGGQLSAIDALVCEERGGLVVADPVAHQAGRVTIAEGEVAGLAVVAVERPFGSVDPEAHQLEIMVGVSVDVINIRVRWRRRNDRQVESFRGGTRLLARWMNSTISASAARASRWAFMSSSVKGVVRWGTMPRWRKD